MLIEETLSEEKKSERVVFVKEALGFDCSKFEIGYISVLLNSGTFLVLVSSTSLAQF